MLIQLSNTAVFSRDVGGFIGAVARVSMFYPKPGARVIVDTEFEERVKLSDFRVSFTATRQAVAAQLVAAQMAARRVNRNAGAQLAAIAASVPPPPAPPQGAVVPQAPPPPQGVVVSAAQAAQAAQAAAAQAAQAAQAAAAQAAQAAQAAAAQAAQAAQAAAAQAAQVAAALQQQQVVPPNQVPSIPVIPSPSSGISTNQPPVAISASRANALAAAAKRAARQNPSQPTSGGPPAARPVVQKTSLPPKNLRTQVISAVSRLFYPTPATPASSSQTTGTPPPTGSQTPPPRTPSPALSATPPRASSPLLGSTPMQAPLSLIPDLSMGAQLGSAGFRHARTPPDSDEEDAGPSQGEDADRDDLMDLINEALGTAPKKKRRERVSSDDEDSTPLRVKISGKRSGRESPDDEDLRGSPKKKVKDPARRKKHSRVG